jgi:hypothetical protein
MRRCRSSSVIFIQSYRCKIGLQVNRGGRHTDDVRFCLSLLHKEV